MGRRFRRARAGVKVTAGVLSAASTAYLGLIAAGDVHARIDLSVVSIAILGLNSLAITVRTVRAEAMRDKLEKQQEAVRQAMEALPFAAAQVTGIDVRSFTASLFLVEGRFRRWQQLERWMRIAFRARTKSTVRWTRGKGVIGQCWETESVVRKNIKALNERRGECSHEEWSQVSVESRMGLSYEDWVKTRGKYDVIVAVPVHRGRRFIGCVALDGPTDGVDWSTESEVTEALEGASGMIAALMG